MADGAPVCRSRPAFEPSGRNLLLACQVVLTACVAAASAPLIGMEFATVHPIQQSGILDPLVGCWRYVNGPAIRVNRDGTVALGQVAGKWRLADAAKRAYVLNWPEILDNAVVSADEKTLTETSPWFTLNATRISGKSGIVGMWQWPGTIILTVRPDGTFTAGPISGKWKAATDLGERTYTLTWPPPIHTGVLAADGQQFDGADQYGNRFASTKEACGND